MGLCEATISGKYQENMIYKGRPGCQISGMFPRTALRFYVCVFKKFIILFALFLLSWKALDPHIRTNR
jgi:hypothetical protein